MANSGLSPSDFQPNFGGIAAVTDAALRTRARNEEIAGLKAQFGTEDTGQAIAARNAQTTAIELIRETKDMSAENANEFFDSFNPMLKQFGLNLSKNPEIGHVITVDKLQDDGSFSRKHQGIDRAGNTFPLDTGQIASHELGLEQAKARRAAAVAGADPTKILTLSADRVLAVQKEAADALNRLGSDPKAADIFLSKWFKPDEFNDNIKGFNSVNAQLDAETLVIEAVRQGGAHNVRSISRKKLNDYMNDPRIDADNLVDAMALMRETAGMKGTSLLFEGFGPSLTGLTLRDAQGNPVPLVPVLTNADIENVTNETKTEPKPGGPKPKDTKVKPRSTVTKAVVNDAAKRVTAIASIDAQIQKLLPQIDPINPARTRDISRQMTELKKERNRLAEIQDIDNKIAQARQDLTAPGLNNNHIRTLENRITRFEQKRKQRVDFFRSQ